MHRQWFGDAYTYAHRALIHGIASPGEWFVHPIVNGGDMLGHWGGVKLYHLNQRATRGRSKTVPPSVFMSTEKVRANWLA